MGPHGLTNVVKDERRLVIRPVVNDVAELHSHQSDHSPEQWIKTHVIDIFTLDGNLAEEVELGKLDSILFDRIGAFTRPNLVKKA